MGSLLKVLLRGHASDLSVYEHLRAQLAPMVRAHVIDLKDERTLPLGEEPVHRWRAAAVLSCDVAILLLSAEYLADDDEHEQVVTKLMKRTDLRIVPVIVRACAYGQSVLQHLPPYPPDGRPVMAAARPDDLLAALVHRLGAWAGQPTAAHALTLRSVMQMRTDAVRRLHAMRQAGGSTDESEQLSDRGLCELRLQMYAAAARSFRRLIHVSPDNADAYFHCALALLGGRSPRALRRQEAQEVTTQLIAASELAPRDGRHLAALAFVSHEYYRINGLTSPLPPPEELFLRGWHLGLEPADVQVLLTLIPMGRSTFTQQMQQIAGTPLR